MGRKKRWSGPFLDLSNMSRDMEKRLKKCIFDSISYFISSNREIKATHVNGKTNFQSHIKHIIGQ